MRAVKINLTFDVLEDTEDKDIADLRDVLIELAERFPGVEVRSYGVTGWRHDGTAIDGMAPTAGSHDERINALLREMAKRKIIKSGTSRTPEELLTFRFAEKINHLREETDLVFRVESTGGNCYWLHASTPEGRHYTLTEYPEVLTASSFPWDTDCSKWNGWFLGVYGPDGWTYNQPAFMFPDEDGSARRGMTDGELVDVILRLEML